MAVHDGHRNRMRKKIEQYGVECLQDHEVLEFLLYALVPRKDTNELAHKILNEFGSLANVFDQSIERLQKVDGVTYNAAVFLSSMSGISRRYFVKRNDKTNISNIENCVNYMRPLIASLPKEEMHMLLGDNNCKLIKNVLLNKGVVNETTCNVREIADIVLKNEATFVVLVHNHPSNNPTPSRADSSLTQVVYCALAPIGVRLVDHIIVTRDSYYSFRESDTIAKLANSSVKFANGSIENIILPPEIEHNFGDKQNTAKADVKKKNKKTVKKKLSDTINNDF